MKKGLGHSALLLLIIAGAEVIDVGPIISNAYADPTSFQNSVNQAIQSNNVQGLSQLMSSASSSDLQGLNSNAFSTGTMTSALSNIAETNPSQLTNIVKGISGASFGNLVGGAIQANNTGLVAASMSSASSNQLQGLNSQAFNTTVMTRALNNIAQNNPSQLTNIVKSIDGASFGSLVGGAIQADNFGLIAASMTSASPNQLQGVNAQAFNNGVMTKALNDIAQNNPSQFTNIVKNISGQSFNNLVGGAIQADNPGLVAASMTSASQLQLQGLNNQVFSTQQMTKALSNIAQSNPSQLANIVKSISGQSFDNLIGGAIQANNPGLVAASMTSASSNQIQGLNSQAYSTPAMNKALSDIAQNKPSQFTNIVKSLSGQSFNNLVGGAILANNSGLVAASMTSASSNQIQGLNSQAFNSPAMTKALNDIAQSNPSQFASMVKTISAESYSNLVGGALQSNDTALLTQALSSGSSQQLQSIASANFNSATMFNSVSTMFNKDPSGFSNLMHSLSGNQVDSLLSSKGYYYNDGNFYSSATHQQVNPSSIFPPTNTLDAGNNNTHGPITTFNPDQLQSKTTAPVDGAQTINPQQQAPQIPTGVQMEKKL